MSDDERTFIDRAADWWEELGGFFGERPIQLIMYGVAAVALIAALAYSTITASNNKTDIGEVKQAFCRSDGFAQKTDHETNNQIHRCQALLTKLLEHPTPEQAARLKQIIKEAP